MAAPEVTPATSAVAGEAPTTQVAPRTDARLWPRITVKSFIGTGLAFVFALFLLIWILLELHLFTTSKVASFLERNYKFGVNSVPKSGFGLIQVPGFGDQLAYNGVDLIFVHGLGSNADTTWSSPAQSGQGEGHGTSDAVKAVCWIEDFLPHDISRQVKEGLRVFHFNHDSFYVKGARDIRLRSLGESLMDHVRTMSAQTMQAHNRSLVFVGHSYGGLIIKQGLVRAKDERRWHDISSRTHGIINLGTPHMGSKAVNSMWLLKLIRPYDSNTRLLEEIVPFSPLLLDLHTDFHAYYKRLDVINFYEERPSTFLRDWWKFKTVDQFSATYAGHAERVINRGMGLNHFQLNKFATRSAEYKMLLDELNELLRPLQVNTFLVPEPLVRTFVPRPKLLRDADMALRQCGSEMAPCTVVFHGLGGAGKSQLARKAIEDWKDRYSTIFWVNAHDSVSLETSFIQFAAHIGIEVTPQQEIGASLRASQAVQRVNTWFQQDFTPSRLWLIVIDGFQNLSQNDLDAIVPNLPNGHVLITSQDFLTCHFVTGKCVDIEVGPMEPAEAGAVILRHLAIRYEDASAEIRDVALEVSQLLDCLALPVQLAGAYIAQRSRGDPVEKLRQYAIDFQRHPDYLLRQEPLRKLSSYEKTVWTVWDISVNEIMTKYPEIHAEKLLTLLSALDGNIIPDDFFRLASLGFPSVAPQLREPYEPMPSWMQEWILSDNSTWDRLKFDDAIDVLRLYSLVQRTEIPSSGTSIHSLVQWRARHYQDGEPWTDWLLILASSAIHRTLYDSKEARHRRLLLAHLAELNKRHGILRCVRSPNEWSGWLSNLFGDFYRIEGQWCQAMMLYEEAFTIFSESLGCDSMEAVAAFENKALVMHAQGRWKEAATMLEWVLHVHQYSRGPDDTKTLATTVQLASTYERLGELNKSETLAIHALEASNRTLGVHDRATLSVMNFVATIYVAQGHLAEAESLLLKAINISKQMPSEDIEATVTYEANLATIYSMSKRSNEAQAMFEEVLNTQERILSENHPTRLRTLSNLAYAYLDQGDLAKSEEIFRDLFASRKYNLGYCHIDTLDSMAAIANILQLRGEREQAITLMTECATIAVEKYERDHPYSIKFVAAIEQWSTSKSGIPTWAALGVWRQIICTFCIWIIVAYVCTGLCWTLGQS